MNHHSPKYFGHEQPREVSFNESNYIFVPLGGTAQNGMSRPRIFRFYLWLYHENKNQT